MSEVKIPEGYKQTEVGVIPEDWDVKELGSQSLKIGSGSDSKDKNGTYPLYGSTGIIGKSKLFSYDQQSILVARVGANAGLVNLVNGKYGVSDNTIVINLNNNNDVEFIKSWLIKKDLNTLVFGSGQPLITGTQLKKLLIALPSKKEQTAIATALSDVDNLIESLEKLIAKKEAIKTGAMQQLLTGKTRLPEFATHDDGSPKGFKQTELGQIPEDWGIRTVFELAERNSSNFNDGDWVESEHIINHGIRLLQTGNIGIGYFVDKGNKKYISEHSFIQLNCKLLEAGDLLICRLAEPAGRACIFKGVEEDKAITSVDVTIFRPPADSVNREFYLQVFSSSDWFNSINEQVGGTTHKRISRSALGSIYVPYPTYQEQTAIATILSDMDTEIQALQQRLEKTRDIKQGMMQQLLTGKVRLAH